MPFTVSTITGFATRRARHPALTPLAVAVCAAVALMLIGARSADTTRVLIASPAQVSPQPRTESERAWNEAEDSKAALYVGRPGIY